ncbi:hypothetical protein LEMLEM_LOCUS10122, partial [Lemmus lemmus]
MSLQNKKHWCFSVISVVINASRWPGDEKAVSNYISHWQWSHTRVGFLLAPIHLPEKKVNVNSEILKI